MRERLELHFRIINSRFFNNYKKITLSSETVKKVFELKEPSCSYAQKETTLYAEMLKLLITVFSQSNI